MKNHDYFGAFSVFLCLFKTALLWSLTCAFFAFQRPWDQNHTQPQPTRDCTMLWHSQYGTFCLLFIFPLSIFFSFQHVCLQKYMKWKSLEFSVGKTQVSLTWELRALTPLSWRKLLGAFPHLFTESHGSLWLLPINLSIQYPEKPSVTHKIGTWDAHSVLWLIYKWGK